MSSENITHRLSTSQITTYETPSASHKQSSLDKEYDQLNNFVQWATYSLPPNIKTFKLKHYANAMKVTIIPLMLFLMWYHNNYSLGCWVYMGLHGSYGFLWNLKTLAFPDSGHEGRVSIGSCPLMFLVMLGYWYIAYMMASGQSEQNPSPERIFWSILVFCMGSSFMMIADAQKYFCLRLKKELINYGMFKLTRNPNYLGEVMLYGSFAMLSGRVLPWLILISVWGSVFVIMIYLKELSFTRKPQWEEYRKQSWVFLPKLWNNDDLSYLTYLFMIVGAGYLYGNGGLFKVLQNFMK